MSRDLGRRRGREHRGTPNRPRPLRCRGRGSRPGAGTAHLFRHPAWTRPAGTPRQLLLALGSTGSEWFSRTTASERRGGPHRLHPRLGLPGRWLPRAGRLGKRGAEHDQTPAGGRGAPAGRGAAERRVEEGVLVERVVEAAAGSPGWSSTGPSEQPTSSWTALGRSSRLAHPARDLGRLVHPSRGSSSGARTRVASFPHRPRPRRQPRGMPDLTRRSRYGAGPRCRWRVSRWMLTLSGVHGVVPGTSPRASWSSRAPFRHRRWPRCSAWPARSDRWRRTGSRRASADITRRSTGC